MCSLFKLIKVVSLPELIDPSESYLFMPLLERFLAEGPELSVGAHNLKYSPTFTRSSHYAPNNEA